MLLVGGEKGRVVGESGGLRDSTSGSRQIGKIEQMYET